MTRTIIGWREWVDLPELNLSSIKVKVDTGARTSALHAFDLKTYHHDGILMLRFAIHPQQKNLDIVQFCHSPVIDRRQVSDSGGHKENRYVIKTPICMGREVWPIELTLTKRDTMKFRMLLGRTAMREKFMVKPDASFLLGKPNII